MKIFNNINIVDLQAIIHNIMKNITDKDYNMLFRNVSNYKERYGNLLSHDDVLYKILMSDNKNKNLDKEDKKFLVLIVYIFSNFNKKYKPGENAILDKPIIYKTMSSNPNFEIKSDTRLLEYGLIVGENEFN